jgi:hypothetical protein
MKKINKSGVFVIAAYIVLSLSNCKKVKDIEQPPLLNPDIVNAMYPVVQSYSEGSQSYLFNYEYDKDNHLVKYSRGNVVDWNISPNQVDVTTNQYSSSSQQLVHTSTTSYVYTLAGIPNTSVNLYESAPTLMTYSAVDKYLTTGTTNSSAPRTVQFANNKDGLPVKVADSPDHGSTYTYDDKKNLVKIEFVRTSGARANPIYVRLTFSSFDDKPSPFSSVKGYWPISFPQAYNWHYALALCKNNPKQSVTEVFDESKNAFVTSEINDYTYTYNDKGYPTDISINTTYYGGVTTHNLGFYHYNYK